MINVKELHQGGIISGEEHSLGSLHTEKLALPLGDCDLGHFTEASQAPGLVTPHWPTGSIAHPV